MARMRDRVYHPIVARQLPRCMARAEAHGQGEHRRELVAGLSGSVLEIGAGAGTNFKYYPASVTEVVATEPESYLRQTAYQAAETAPVAVHVIDAMAERLPFDDASFDAGVVSLVLCSVQDPARALAELRRVIRPGGELRFYEHVRSTSPVVAGLQRLADALLWPRLNGGCHCARDTAGLIEKAGFVLEQHRRLSFRYDFVSFHLSSHILGTARRPAKRRNTMHAHNRDLARAA